MAEVEKATKVNLAPKTPQESLDPEQMKQMIMNAQVQLVNLQNENNKLKEYLNQFEFQKAIERIKFLFKILESPNFFTQEDIVKSAQEISKSLFEGDVQGDPQCSCEEVTVDNG